MYGLTNTVSSHFWFIMASLNISLFKIFGEKQIFFHSLREKVRNSERWLDELFICIEEVRIYMYIIFHLNNWHFSIVSIFDVFIRLRKFIQRLCFQCEYQNETKKMSKTFSFIYDLFCEDFCWLNKTNLQLIEWI